MACVKDALKYSRNLENLTLLLSLKNQDGTERYRYTYYTSLDEFREITYEKFSVLYDAHISQQDTDDIEEKEVKFFVWAKPAEWAFEVVPVYRKEQKLFLGKPQTFYFEHDGWVQNYFDGSK